MFKIIDIKRIYVILCIGQRMSKTIKFMTVETDDRSRGKYSYSLIVPKQLKIYA